jgi:hypothetical protein
MLKDRICDALEGSNHAKHGNGDHWSNDAFSVWMSVIVDSGPFIVVEPRK